MSINDAAKLSEIQNRIREELQDQRGVPQGFDVGVILTPLIEAIPQIITSILQSAGCGASGVQGFVEEVQRSEERKHKAVKRLARQIKRERDKEFDKWMKDQKDKHSEEQRDGNLWLREAEAAVEAMLENEDDTIEMAAELEVIG